MEPVDESKLGSTY